MILHKLTKNRARTYIIFEEDFEMDPDGWFIAVKFCNTKDDTIRRESCITKKDVERWVKSHLSDGWDLNEDL